MLETKVEILSMVKENQVIYGNGNGKDENRKKELACHHISHDQLQIINQIN